MKVDGPLADAMLRQAVRGEIEDVPAFNSISYEGVVHRCVAFCNDRGKEYRLPLNAWATALWHSALRRQGFERGLRREDGTVADRLVGMSSLSLKRKRLGSLQPWRNRQQ
jgi:hypothetical protein